MSEKIFKSLYYSVLQKFFTTTYIEVNSNAIQSYLLSKCRYDLNLEIKKN